MFTSLCIVPTQGCWITFLRKCLSAGHSTLVSLTALVAIIVHHKEAGAGGGNYANCNTVNFGPACFATYNNHHLRIWNPDGSRPDLTHRQKSDLWKTLLNIHAGVSKNTSHQSWSYKIDPIISQKLGFLKLLSIFN